MTREQRLIAIKKDMYRHAKHFRHFFTANQARQAWEYLIFIHNENTISSYVDDFDWNEYKACFIGGIQGRMPYELKNNWQKKRSLRQQRSIQNTNNLSAPILP